MSAKQKHLIGVGASIAAGCRPWHALVLPPEPKPRAACVRGLRLTVERAVESEKLSLNEMELFTNTMFEKPEIDDAFREGRAALDALIAVATAVASNTASSLASAVALARNTGATEVQLHTAAQIGRTARRGAENETEKEFASLLGRVSPLSHGESSDGATAPCNCGCSSEE